MRYQKIRTCIWSDEKFVQLSQDARYLFLYILTSPHSNSLGLYHLPKAYIQEDLLWSSDRLETAFNQLVDNGLILYDLKVKIVLICNQLKHNPIENKNQTISNINVVRNLPRTHLFEHLLKVLTKPYHKQLIEELVERLPEGYGKPKEKEKEKNNIVQEKCPLDDSDVKKVLNDLFDNRFINHFPPLRRQKKKPARGKYQKIICPNGEIIFDLVGEIENNLIKRKETDEWKNEKGKYFPMPTTYLSQERWKDDIEEMKDWRES